MELKGYLKIIRKYWVIIVILPLVSTLIAFYVTRNQPLSFEGSITLIVSPTASENRVDPPYYEYDGYYAVQSSQIFASTIANWFTSPDVVFAIYDEADIELKVKNTEEVRTKIRSLIQESKINSNSVDAQVKGSSKKDTKVLALACAKVVITKTEIFNQMSGTKVQYKVSALGDPVIIQIEPKVVLNSFIALFGSTVVAILLIFLVHYFKKK